IWAVLGVAARAAALVITTPGSPTYTLPGGGSCTVSGTATAQSAGATWTCTGVNTSAHTHVYFGMRVDTNPNGNTMTGLTGPTTSSSSIFSSVTGTNSSSITYGGSTTTVNDQIHGARTVANSMVLTTAGSTPGTVVGRGVNGTATSCCNATCTLKASTSVCYTGAGAGDPCDPSKTCTGSSPTCPAATTASSTFVCRAAGGTCDVAENCTGVAGVACPG